MHDAYTINSLTSLAYLLLLALWADRYERESALLLVRLFFLGVVLTGVFALVKCLGLGLCRPDVASPVVEAYVVAGAAEEALKFGIFAAVLPRLRGLDEPMDPIVYLGVIALAFTFHENIGYFLSFTAEGQRVAAASGDLALYRQQLGFIVLARAVPGHLLFDTVAGGLLAFGHRRGQLRRWLLPAYLLAVALHGTWNLLAGAGRWWPFLLYGALLVAGTAATVVWALRISPHRWRQGELRRELVEDRGLDPALVRRVIRAMRRCTGERQAGFAARVRRLARSDDGSRDADLAELLAEERRYRGRGTQFWELVMGILLAGMLAHLVIALVGQAVFWVGCGAV